MVTEFDLGDRILMKKPHACGSSEWTITRTGADIKIRCCGCGRIVMLDRQEFVKKAKKNLTGSSKMRALRTEKTGRSTRPFPQ